MIAIDTNVLVRFVVRDDVAQGTRAAALIRRAIAKDEPLFVSEVVVCEFVWVLSVSYQFARDEIANALAKLFRAKHLQFRSTDVLLGALKSYGRGKGDFADYLILEHAREAGCLTVATFDRAILKEPEFVKVG